ncbi:BTB/POZ domain-containing protein 3-like isoform X1 [Centruroides vittatus]|uniref:BTB/POZ domain-containing protein 3-like isoform X1 n=1 Tax=Centruroides vittatus TaxID=120091 RepID=UPI00350FFED4
MAGENLVERTSSLLEKKTFTDVTFIVGPGSSAKKYTGHKVLLAMTSPVFKVLLSGDMADKAKVVRVNDISPIGFENLLRYAYTDNLSLETVEDAMLTAYAAKKYALPHLMRECIGYLETNVCPKSVCDVYEFALNMEAHLLVFLCLNIIDRQTYHVLTSSAFLKIPFGILEKIVRRPYLNIYSEYTLYNAVFMWAEQECKRKKLEPEIENIRAMLDPFLPHLRFLAMSAEEFCKGPAKSGLLTIEECFNVFMNLAVPGSSQVPKGFSTETAKRTSPPEYFVCRRYKTLSFSSPSRPLRLFGARFSVMNRDVFLVGVGFPVRQERSYYSVRQHKIDGVFRILYRPIEGKLSEREEYDVQFVLSKDKDVRVKLNKPFYIRKGLKYDVELHVHSLLVEDIVVPVLKNRKKEDTSRGVTFQFYPFQRVKIANVLEILEFSEILFYC